jgi:hypothetical protein
MAKQKRIVRWTSITKQKNTASNRHEAVAKVLKNVVEAEMEETDFTKCLSNDGIKKLVVGYIMEDLVKVFTEFDSSLMIEAKFDAEAFKKIVFDLKSEMKARAS